MKEIIATEKEIALTNVLNLQQDVVVIFTSEAATGALNETLTTSNRDHDISIEFSNARSIDLFGIDLSELSVRQLSLPQFIPLERLGTDPRLIYSDKHKLKLLRESINESLWTGLPLANLGLVSLKEILQKEPSVNVEEQVEEYIMLSSIVSDLDDEQSIDFAKDFHLVVKRTKIDFNKKSCQLLTFKDVSVHHRLKHHEEKGQLLKAVTDYVQQNVI